MIDNCCYLMKVGTGNLETELCTTQGYFSEPQVTYMTPNNM
jgi:hypothetical protein